MSTVACTRRETSASCTSRSGSADTGTSEDTSGPGSTSGPAESVTVTQLEEVVTEPAESVAVTQRSQGSKNRINKQETAKSS